MKQDIAAIAGIVLIVGGIAAWSLPAAAIVLGLVFAAWAYVTSGDEAKQITAGKKAGE